MRVLVIGKTSQISYYLRSIKRVSCVVVGLPEVDVNQIHTVELAIKYHKPNILINTAAFHKLIECEKNMSQSMAINAIAVGEMAKLCERLRVRFFTFSTDYVFDGLKCKPYDEGDIPHPLQVYGTSKLEGERLTLLHAPTYGYVIRTSGLYGGLVGSRQKGGNFVLSILKQGKKGGSISVVSNQISSPTYAGDLVGALIDLICKNPPPGIYHIANDGACSWAQFAQKILFLAHSRAIIVPIDRDQFEDGIARPMHTVLAQNKINQLNIFVPMWDDALNRYIRELN